MKKEDIIQKIFAPIMDSGFRCWFVGGCVRDSLLGETPNDFDICTSATPTELHKIFNKFSDVSKNSEKFGVTMVLVDNEEIEIATLRKDITKGRHPQITFTDCIQEDSERRDFTINSLYEDSEGRVWDPTGLGKEDLSNHTLRFVGDPRERVEEDPLRILRFIRFLSQKDFSSAYSCLEFAKISGNIDFSEVSKERQLKELRKIFSGKNYIKTLPFFFEARLVHLGFHSVISDMMNVQQSWKWHSEGAVVLSKETGEVTFIESNEDLPEHYDFVKHGNVWDHTLKVMRNMDELSKTFDEEHRFLLNMAAFLHDIGKPHSDLGMKENVFLHEGKEVKESIKKVSDHDKVGAPFAESFCKDLMMSNEEVQFVKHLTFMHMRMHQLPNIKSKYKLWKLVSDPLFEDLVLLAKADEMGCVKTVSDEWRGIDTVLEEERIKELRGKPMPARILTGDFLIEKGLKPDKTFSKKLEKAHQFQIDEDIEDKEVLFKKVKGIQ